MSRFRRLLPLLGATVAVLAGTVLLMGNLHNDRNRVVQLQQSRIETLARTWEARLGDARALFRDQLLHDGLLIVLDHPDEWSDQRIATKLEAVRNAWSKTSGALRGLALVSDDIVIRTAVGDTARLGEALRNFLLFTGTDVCLLNPGNGTPRTLALQYYSPVADPNVRSGRIIAVVDPKNMFALSGNQPQEWILLSAADQMLAASSGKHANLNLSHTAWSLLIAEGNGTVSIPGNGMLCFSRVQIPGMNPLLLLQSIPQRVAWFTLVGIGFILLGGVLAIRYAQHKGADLSSASEPAATSLPEPAGEFGFRHLFNALEDGVCIISATGRVVRTNPRAEEWLGLSGGQPNENVRVQIAGQQATVSEFLVQVVSNPQIASGPVTLIADHQRRICSVRAKRLFADEQGRGPLLLHFREMEAQQDYATLLMSALKPTRLDALAPYPVLSVSRDGLVEEFNAAAEKACPRLVGSPLLADVLPNLEGCDVTTVLSAETGFRFESLFGSQMHEFEVVNASNHLLLYAHPLAASKRLDMELKQAQESFFSLCALVPAPVLLADPRDHTIMECNAAAADLFATTPADLRSRLLDDLAEESWEESVRNGILNARTFSGQGSPCRINYELIKVEGTPALLIVLAPEDQTVLPSRGEESVELELPTEPATPPEPEPLPLGPGLLITLNPTVREVARRLLERLGHPVESFSSLDDATVWLITHEVRPEMTAIDLTDFDDGEVWIEEMRERCGGVPCIALTDGEGYVLPEGGANVLLLKPFDLDSISAALETAGLEVFAQAATASSAE